MWMIRATATSTPKPATSHPVTGARPLELLLRLRFCSVTVPIHRPIRHESVAVKSRYLVRDSRLALAPGTKQEVDLVLFTHYEVLQQVLEGLRTALAPGRLERRLKRLDRLRFAFDQPLDGVARVAPPAQLGDLGGRLAAEGRDLLDQQAGVLQLELGEFPEPVAEGLKLEAEQRPRAERLLERRPVLEPQRLVQQLDRLFYVEFLVVTHERRTCPRRRSAKPSPRPP